MHFRIGIVMSILYKKGKDTVKKTCQVIVKQTGTSQSEPTFAPEIKKATENNPILTNCYVADPAVMEYNGRIYVYMTNDSQHYERGEKLENCGNVFGVAGNNHHSIIKFNDKYYMFYHTRALETALGSDLGFRSSHVNELTVNADGTLEPVKQDLTGVSQIKAFNPYEETKGIS